MKQSKRLIVKNIVQQSRNRRGRGRPLKHVEQLGYRIPVEIHNRIKAIKDRNKEMLNDSKSYFITCLLVAGVEKAKTEEGLIKLVEQAELFFRRQKAIKFRRAKQKRMIKE